MKVLFIGKIVSWVISDNHSIILALVVLGSKYGKYSEDILVKESIFIDIFNDQYFAKVLLKVLL